MTIRQGEAALTARQANFALGVFLLAYVLSFVDRQILSLMVDPIRRDLGISDVQVGLLQGAAFVLLYSVCGIPIGLLADRFSRKWIIAAGVLVWSVATAVCGIAGSFALLFAGRMGVGLGEATLSPSVHSFLADAFPRARLARAMGIYTVGISLGGGLALLVGGSLIEVISNSGDLVLAGLGTFKPWQATFLVVALPGVLVALLVALVREPPRAPRAAAAADDKPAFGLRPLLRHMAMHRRAFAGLYASTAILGVAAYGTIAWAPTLLIRSHGLGAMETGFYLGLLFVLLGGAGSVCGGLLSERLARRGHEDANLRVILMVALGLMVPGTLAPLMPSPLLALAMLTPVCFFNNAYFGCATAAIQLATPVEVRATASAMFMLFISIAGMAVGSVAVPLVDLWFFAGDGTNIGASLAIVILASCLVAAMAAFLGLRPYGKLLRDGAGPHQGFAPA